MKDKFLIWLGRNRQSVGYTIGILNILAGIMHLFQLEFLQSVVWLIIGTIIIFDTYRFK